MFRTLATLFDGANARAEDRVRDAFALELIDQKIREADASLKAAKSTLASLIQRQRAEDQHRQGLQSRITALTNRAKAALDADKLSRLDQKILRLRSSMETAQRRIVDLRQGAIQAKAVRREQTIQSRMVGSDATDSAAEAEALIANVLQKDDPFERSQILSEIDAGLNHDTLSDRMADAGFGPATRATADDVLKRLKASK